MVGSTFMWGNIDSWDWCSGYWTSTEGDCSDLQVKLPNSANFSFRLRRQKVVEERVKANPSAGRRLKRWLAKRVRCICETRSCKPRHVRVRASSTLWRRCCLETEELLMPQLWGFTLLLWQTPEATLQSCLRLSPSSLGNKRTPYDVNVALQRGPAVSQSTLVPSHMSRPWFPSQPGDISDRLREQTLIPYSWRGFSREAGCWPESEEYEKRVKVIK